MSEAKTNILFICKKCRSEGTLAKNVTSFDFSQLKKLPCGCSADNGKFHFLHPMS